MYLNERGRELAAATLQSHGYRIKQFVQWCEQDGIDDLNDLTGRDIHRFRVKRRSEDQLAVATIRGQLATLRVFLRFCASVDGVEAGLDEKITLPPVTASDARTELLESDRAHEILEFLEKYRYATLEHALLEVLWHTGLRIGAAIGLDVGDVHSDEGYLELQHRPAEGTPLKNNLESERLVAVSERVCRVLDDWLEVNHSGIIDEFGREPLFATGNKRLSTNRGRSIAYQYTRPCVYSNECPHGREIDDCDARPTERAYACPSALSPHPIRRGAITHHLQQDTPEKVVSDRMDVGENVLDRHYDQRTPIEKMRQRQRYLPME